MNLNLIKKWNVSIIKNIYCYLWMFFIYDVIEILLYNLNVLHQLAIQWPLTLNFFDIHTTNKTWTPITWTIWSISWKTEEIPVEQDVFVKCSMHGILNKYIPIYMCQNLLNQRYSNLPSMKHRRVFFKWEKCSKRTWNVWITSDSGKFSGFASGSSKAPHTTPWSFVVIWIKKWLVYTIGPENHEQCPF